MTCYDDVQGRVRMSCPDAQCASGGLHKACPAYELFGELPEEGTLKARSCSFREFDVSLPEDPAYQ